MEKTWTDSVENYLKAIFDLTAKGDRATTNLLAERLCVTPASVTGMVQKLADTDPPLLEYRKHHGVVLTEHGRRVALQTIRHHRLIEMFLHQILGFPWDEVHAEAEQLEHVISEKMEERIAQVLGDPTHDPHGDPIPTRDLEIPPSTSVRLSELRVGQDAVVQRVRDSNSELLRHLEKLGLQPDARLHVQDYSSFDENLTLMVEGQKDPVVLGPRVTHQVYVEPIN
ncbi:MAG: metal-dependent transcriptional regulator [Anaerolineales bacterium]|jgi:DtxR family Mn-dependent transcriptional regulator